MIFRALAPRSLDWLYARSSIPTSSSFHRIVTPGGKLSAQSGDYMNRLLAEWWVGNPVPEVETDHMKRGTEMEPFAIAHYEFQTDQETTVGGFFLTDDGMVGSSPDRLVGDTGILEIKAPIHSTQMGYLIGSKLDEAYRPQLQGQLWVCEREWSDIVSFHPELPAKVMRVERDEEYIGKLSAAVGQFVERMLAHREALVKEYGPPKKREGELNERETEALDMLSRHHAITADDEDRIVAALFPV